MDGWGIGNSSYESAVYKAKTPFYNKILNNHPNSKLEASGISVGLPKGQMGNSEVGHMNIGAGRVVDQDLIKLNKALENGGIKNKSDFIDAVNYSKDNKKAFHVTGLFSKGGVHSHSDHLYLILDFLKKSKLENVFLHLFTDGRDCSPNEGYNDLSELLRFIENSNISLASISGRYYSMDRDNRWERIKLTYDVMVNGTGIMSENVLKAIKESYSKDITDEFIKPIVCINSKGAPKGLISDGDVLFSFNYRSDRMRQISKVLTQENNDEFEMKKLNLKYLTLTQYDQSFKNIQVLFNKENIKNTIGEVLSNNSKRQLRIAETEKYPHVTFFFSGGREKEFNLESRILCKSPNVATYDLQPEMSAKELSLNFIREMEKESFDFACLNFANPDMVGHTGDFNAAVKACEVVDNEVSKIVTIAKKMGYTILVTADHGNAEKMINDDGSPHTYHTTNLVPFIIISDKNFIPKDGKLGDIAPTVLKIMDIDVPSDMSGKILI
jgi:2,3-bisphosphoglycerate-independent phosphoglycerate mutase